MFKVILIDDERLALRNMEKLLEKFSDISIIGQFKNPFEALEAMSHLTADVAFLDMEMPGMMGVELAERLQQLQPGLQIVFVTAYNEYAVDAFELHALDYLLKPVRKERLEKTIERIKAQVVGQLMDKIEREPEQAMIRMFGSLRFETVGNGQQVIPFQWRTQKSQELFAYLVHQDGRSVRKDALIEILWPDYTEDRAFTNLYTTIYQLRKSLKQCEMNIHIINEADGYRLERHGVQVDVEEWVTFMTDVPPVTDETLPKHQQAIAWHRKAYLQEYDYEWAIHKQLQLNMKWLDHVIDVCEYYMTKKRFADGIALCYDIRERFPYAEYSYFTMMKIFALLGDHDEVERQFQSYANIISEELNEKPDAEIVAWYEHWKHDVK